MHKKLTRYKGTYIKNGEDADPIMHGEGEFRIGPERFIGWLFFGDFSLTKSFHMISYCTV